MRRIMVIGCPGAGKSTLARRLGERLGLPVIHLDKEYWKPGWTEPDKADWRAAVETLAARTEWVMDGDYRGTLDIRMPRADVVVHLDFPRWRCLTRVLRRVAGAHGTTRPDMGQGCPERLNWTFLKYVWDYPRNSREGILRMLARMRPDQRLVVLRTPAEVRAFEAALPASLTNFPTPEAA